MNNIKSFQNFILNEDFNSSKATQFTVSALSSVTKSNENVVVFYESIKNRSFNLSRYLKSFNTQIAREVLGNTGIYWRGLIYNRGSDLHVFIWKGSVLHNNLAKALDNNSNKTYPAMSYSKTYTNMVLGDISSDNWVFPLIYVSNMGMIKTNIDDLFLKKIEDKFHINDLFKLGADFDSITKA